MEEICQNCRCFVQGSIMSEYIWGDCMKQRNYVPDADNKGKRGIFTWGHKTCSDFKPPPQNHALKTNNLPAGP